MFAVQPFSMWLGLLEKMSLHDIVSDIYYIPVTYHRDETVIRLICWQSGVKICLKRLLIYAH